jgi:hypothetical protein
LAKSYDKKVKALHVHQRLSSGAIDAKRELNCMMDLKFSMTTMLDGRMAIFVHFTLNDDVNVKTVEG